MNISNSLKKKMSLETIKVKRQWIKKVNNREIKSTGKVNNYERDNQKFRGFTDEIYDETNFEASNEKISMIAPADSESIFYGEDALLLMDVKCRENENLNYEQTSDRGYILNPDNLVEAKEAEQQFTIFKNNSKVTLEKIQEEESMIDFDLEEDDNNVIVIGKNGLVKDYYRNSCLVKNGKQSNVRKEYADFDIEDESGFGLNILEAAGKLNKSDLQPIYSVTEENAKNCMGFWEGLFSVFRCNPKLQEEMEARLSS